MATIIVLIADISVHGMDDNSIQKEKSESCSLNNGHV